MSGAHSDAAMIAEVEGALRLLLDPATPPGDKQQLEEQLTRFKETPAACLPVLFQLLSTSQNEYSLWFAATTLEEYVAKKWVHFPASEQLRIRQFVWDHLLASSSSSGGAQVAFVRRKMRKVVADIAKIQWRGAEQGDATWPDFMSQIEALIVEERTRESGLELLSVVVEEFGRDDAMVMASIKKQAKARLTAQLPSILALLANVLKGCSHRLQVGEAQVIVAQDRVVNVALTTLNNLITWAPVAEQVSDAWCLAELMNKRFAPARVDEIVGHVMFGLCPLLQKTVEEQLIGRATEQYLDKLSEFVELFLTQHLKRLENPKYGDILPTFLQSVHAFTTKQPHVEGFLNCLRVWEVFVSYIEEIEQDEGAANERVRAVLTAYETGLVAVMLHLVERVRYESNRSQLDELDDGGDAGTQGDHEDADNSAAFDLESTGGAYGQGSLQDLAQIRTDVASGNASATMVELSERKQFVVDCIALIRRIAALPSCAPPLLKMMLPCVQNSVETMLFHIHEMPVIAQQSEQWEQQRCVVRDLTVNCAILSGVCAHYYSISDDMKQQMAGWHILHLFINMSEYMVQHRLHTRGDAFAELQCEALTSIRFCLSCIPFVIKSGARQDVLNASESVLQVLLHTLDTSIVPSPLAVMQNSMQLLANLGFVLSYEDMVQIPSMTQLEAHIHQFSLHLPLAIQGDLYTSMSNSILNSAISLRGNSGVSNTVQPWENAYGSLLVPIRESIDQSAVALHQNEQRVLEHAMVAQLRRDCYLVRCLARSVETKPKVAKDAFFSVFQASFPSLMALLTTYFTTIRKMATSNTPQSKNQIKSALKVVNEIVRLYAQLLKSIRKEMHKETVSEIMRTFVDIFNDSQLSGVLYNQGNAGLMVLCGFLQLLKIVVEEPTSVFSSFLQNILDLCFGPLKEVIFSHPESDSVILGYFVALVEQLLEKHYRFFIVYSGQFTPDGARERGYASDQAHTYFLSIFQSLASVLSREGSNLAPRICKQVLGLLDRVDKAQGLFAFTGFQSELRMGFLSTLMNILTRGEMNLLQDEVIQLLHRVAAVDFASFYQVFLNGYIKEILTQPQLEAASKMEGECLQWSGQVDLPTFSQEVVAFLNDLKVIKAQN
ncbi:exportin-6-like protein [Phytophthora infestans T30-4]|uniref:Exportin-6-like protein n=1 Tax=Phytophthora infestans (strain T30-4) TaxID=403677 RepID=D0NBN9_PHYIT|nr:exportin-6-like protein [Phytophthora infestans T30-4]EEY55194.1 exportin-6-like protein [Phytophthora infestans T30-4]|eukprot:XP_002903418.1 exportin-6-like protein [Phytophthora infestans T30-4]